MARAAHPSERLHDILEDFDCALLVTHTTEGGLHARPMAVAELREDGDLYFISNADSPKIAEIEHEAQVCVTFQSSAQFAAIYGTARIDNDRALIERVWSPAWQVWFPRGKDDPAICVIRVSAHHAEYWDNAGMQGVKYAWEAAKSLMQSRTPQTDAKQHGRVKL